MQASGYPGYCAGFRIQSIWWACWLKYQRYHSGFRIPRILCRLLTEYTGHDKRAIFEISIKICGLQNTQDTVRTLNTPNVEQTLKTWPGFCADSKYLVCGLQNTQGTTQASEYPGYHASLKSIRKYSRVFRKVLRSFQLFVVSSCLLGGIDYWLQDAILAGNNSKLNNNKVQPDVLSKTNLIRFQSSLWHHILEFTTY